MPSTKLVLFDIDGTLVLTGRAGVRAMNRACEEIIGHTEALNGIAVAGRTDWVILHDALRAIGHEMDEELFGRLRDRYVTLLRDEILLRGEGVKAIMPGVQELLDELRRRTDVFLALLTGNFEQGARIKLEHFNLWHYFRCGAFGDDAPDRNALVPFALERARSCGMEPLAAEAVFVVGDTPHDVACARAVGAVPIGVATGSFSVADLRASGADIVFADLSDTAAFLNVIGH
jgi:phosphoglycolate phosphatase-like HAD superfamily hydrolase